VKAAAGLANIAATSPRPPRAGRGSKKAEGGDASKAAAEIVVQAYRDQFVDHGLLVGSARGGNVFGGGDWGLDRLVPDAVRAFSSNHLLRVHHPDAVRSWQHVVEPLAGYMMLARAVFDQGAYFARSWNFGPENANIAPVGKVADILAEAWGDGARWESVPPQAGMHEPAWLHLDSTRSATELGWRCSGNLNGALRSTMRFYRACAFSATAEAIRQLMRSDRVGFAEANLWTSL
jgi:CDP-glucose 4,6-dehydratase